VTADIPHTPDDPTPINFDSLVLSALHQASELERLGELDAAIGVLKKNPNDVRVRMALGKAFEAKSRIGDERAFLMLAMEQYRAALRLKPEFLGANEALISSAYRAGLLDDLLNEYRLRYKSDPDSPVFRDFMRKAEIFLSLPKAKPNATAIPARGFIHFFVKRIFPAASIISFLAALILSIKADSTASSMAAHLCLRVGFSMGIAYLIGWFLLSQI
jgi:hypothetical protein